MYEAFKKITRLSIYGPPACVSQCFHSLKMYVSGQLSFYVSSRHIKKVVTTLQNDLSPRHAYYLITIILRYKRTRFPVLQMLL